MLNLLLLPILALAPIFAQLPDRGAHQLQLQTPDGLLLYGISIPRGYEPGKPRPLILALHPGGERMPYYGSAFMRQIVAPALSGLDAIIVAPDCPTRAWSDPGADRSVMALLQNTLDNYAIDRRRILVVGFSMGGRGTWFFAAHHSDLFTAAIPMAASIGDESQDRLGTMPTYIIHSRDDQVVPFDPAERNARELEKLGRPVRFEALEGIGHYQMGGYLDALRRAGNWIIERWSKEPSSRK
jgi:predicted peptidase